MLLRKLASSNTAISRVPPPRKKPTDELEAAQMVQKHFPPHGNSPVQDVLRQRLVNVRNRPSRILGLVLRALETEANHHTLTRCASTLGNRKSFIRRKYRFALNQNAALEIWCRCQLPFISKARDEGSTDPRVSNNHCFFVFCRDHFHRLPRKTGASTSCRLVRLRLPSEVGFAIVIKDPPKPPSHQ